MTSLQWFRMYHRIIDDEKIRMLAFEDRWHFVALCSLKCSGLLDEPEGDMKWRKVALKLGVQLRELDEIKRRLFEVGLVDSNLNPVAWEDLQYQSDTSTDRVKKFREKTRPSKVKRFRNVAVTVQETETDTELEADGIANAIPFSAKRADATDGPVTLDRYRDEALFAACERVRGRPVPSYMQREVFEADVVAKAKSGMVN